MLLVIVPPRGPAVARGRGRGRRRGRLCLHRQDRGQRSFPRETATRNETACLVPLLRSQAALRPRRATPNRGPLLALAVAEQVVRRRDRIRAEPESAQA